MTIYEPGTLVRVKDNARQTTLRGKVVRVLCYRQAAAPRGGYYVTQQYANGVWADDVELYKEEDMTEDMRYKRGTKVRVKDNAAQVGLRGMIMTVTTYWPERLGRDAYYGTRESPGGVWARDVELYEGEDMNDYKQKYQALVVALEDEARKRGWCPEWDAFAEEHDIELTDKDKAIRGRLPNGSIIRFPENPSDVTWVKRDGDWYSSLMGRRFIAPSRKGDMVVVYDPREESSR